MTRTTAGQGQGPSRLEHDGVDDLWTLKDYIDTCPVRRLRGREAASTKDQGPTTGTAPRPRQQSMTATVGLNQPGQFRIRVCHRSSAMPRVRSRTGTSFMLGDVANARAIMPSVGPPNRPTARTARPGEVRWRSPGVGRHLPGAWPGRWTCGPVLGMLGIWLSWQQMHSWYPPGLGFVRRPPIVMECLHSDASFVMD